MNIEDITNLGWTYEKTHAGMDESFFSKDIDGTPYEYLGLDYDTTSKWLRIYYNKLEGDTTRFSGFIETLKEFIVLLKQLRIE